MSLSTEIRNYKVPEGSLALWWFGQNGYIVKTPGGIVAGVDLYLSDSCNGLEPGMNLRRAVPILIPPAELDVDLYLCTHSHQDHTDPETIRNLRHKDTMQFIGPHESCRIFSAEGIESSRILTSYPKCEFEFGDLHIRGTFALPTDDTDLNHMGFIFRSGASGTKVYMTGDTDYTELLFEAAKHSPDVVITCINGGFNNLSHWEAATLVGKIKPKVAIPCHYDMFPDNSVDPKQFRAAMVLRAPDVQYQELAYGKPYLFSFQL
jgi:Predicted Zn-dependent hydrolases of the beta-lactamase fold